MKEFSKNIRQGYFERKIEANDLTKIENGYIYGQLVDGDVYYPTLKELTTNYNNSVNNDSDKAISYEYVQQLSFKGKWKARKLIIQNKINETKTENELREILSASSTLDAMALEAVTKLYRIVNLGLATYDDVFTDEYKSDYDLDNLPEVNTKDLLAYVNTVEKLITIQRRLLGEDDPVTSIYKEIKQLESNAKDDKSDVLSELEKQLKELKLEQSKVNKKKP